MEKRNGNGEGLSLREAHGSVFVPAGGPGWRRWLAVAGPALMVAVGYMDPGNWATDLAAGSRYEYRLLWVLLAANLVAIVLQSLAARLGIVRRLDLAQASRRTYPAPVNVALYALAESAIVACDLAEVLGSAIALELLFGLPLALGVLATALDVLLLLALMRFGVRKLEAVVLSLVGSIACAFAVEIVLARPDWGAIGAGFLPALPDAGALYLAVGIFGATVMPHNLYLHSALVQTRRFAGGADETRRAIRLNAIDSVVSLNLAFFVNAAILVVAGAVFFRAGRHDVAELQDAHRLLEPLVGAAIAPLLFALALLAAGQSSTVTGTLAGQVVMEGYLDLRMRPWLRRALTRGVAVVPALFCVVHFGEGSAGGLLVLSQVILSLQLPFAAVPLVQFVCDRRTMGPHAVRGGLKTAAWGATFAVVALNVWLVGDAFRAWLAAGGAAATAVRFVALPLGAALAALLVWVTLWPMIAKRRREPIPARAPAGVHAAAAPARPALEPPPPIARAAIALDFSGREETLLSGALRVLGAARPRLLLCHVVESAPARAFGRDAEDVETGADERRLAEFAEALRPLGFEVDTALGAGDPARELARICDEAGVELVILGGHGHRGLADAIHGTTAEALRHRVKASVLVVPLH